MKIPDMRFTYSPPFREHKRSLLNPLSKGQEQSCLNTVSHGEKQRGEVEGRCGIETRIKLRMFSASFPLGK